MSLVRNMKCPHGQQRTRELKMNPRTAMNFSTARGGLWRGMQLGGVQQWSLGAIVCGHGQREPCRDSAERVSRLFEDLTVGSFNEHHLAGEPQRRHSGSGGFSDPAPPIRLS